MPTLEDHLALRTTAPGRFVAEVPDGWQQGRGAFGGLVAGLLVRATEAVNADATRALRTLTAELVAPVEVGAATILVEALRIGSGVSTIAARLVQKDELRAHAVAVFGRARDPQLTWQTDFTPPAWDALPVLAIGPPLGPVFAQHFEYRPERGMPFSGSESTDVSGYIRPREPGRARDAAFIAACADAYWPTLLPRLTAPRPVSTLSFVLELLAPLAGLPDDAPLYHRATSPGAADGYLVEYRELRGVDGRLVALNQQTFVAIR